ncbi:hypothetical protein ACOJVU_09375 [Mycobacterium sp. THU-M104]|uniref:hypothetical protein n=1 Tax=Mycobacterium sp. THU-M104 TaxID=3410515 RepID=UPI003B9CB4A7
MKRFFILPAPVPIEGRRTESGAVRIAAIDFAHRQSRHFVLIERAHVAANSAAPMLKDIK